MSAGRVGSARPSPRVAILLTGDELLDGRVRDTNGAYLSASLVAAGFRVDALTVVPDEGARIVAQIANLLQGRPALLVISGGLGTTHDDVTMAAVAEAAGAELVEDVEAWRLIQERVREVARRRGIDSSRILAQAHRQAFLPAGASMIPPAGVAPGALLPIGDTTVVVLPGVPAELESMWGHLLPRLVADHGDGEEQVTVVRVHGVGEMQVAPLLSRFAARPLRMAITATLGDITVRIGARDEDGRQAAAELVQALSAALPVYSTDGRTIDDIVAQMLLERSATVACAESCTGGMLAGRLTDRPGSSEYFLGAIVSYADAIKSGLLGVPDEMLRRLGAVSAEVAAAMADGVRRLMGTTYGLSTTGIAGPTGGTPEKPVGLVFLGFAGPTGTRVQRRLYGGFGRDAVRRQGVQGALHLLREALQEGS